MPERAGQSPLHPNDCESVLNFTSATVAVASINATKYSARQHKRCIVGQGMDACEDFNAQNLIAA
eukprot:5153452-Amphidinium_carterae.1